MSSHLSQKELESYLWGAATLLRGLIDASACIQDPSPEPITQLVLRDIANVL